MKFSAGILAAIAVIAVISASSGWLRSYVISKASGGTPACLEMLGSSTTEEDGLTYIVGSIKNNCDSRFGHVTVLFKLDRVPGPTEDLSEGVAYAYSRDVEPGETRTFNSALPLSRNATYRYDRMNAF